MIPGSLSECSTEATADALEIRLETERKPNSAWELLLAAFNLDSGSEAGAEAGRADAWQRFIDGATPIIVRLIVV